LLIAVLFVILFVLLLFGKTAKTRRMELVFSFGGLGVCFIVFFIYPEFMSVAPIGFFCVLSPMADLIARPILRKRVMPPCVRVKVLSQIGNRIGIALIILLFLGLSLFIFSLVTESSRSLEGTVLLALLIASIVIHLILVLPEKQEICGNGIWYCGTLQMWGKYESFSWITTDKEAVVELAISGKKPYEFFSTLRLVVPPESREAVHQLLEANLPELSEAGTNLVKET